MGQNFIGQRGSFEYEVFGKIGHSEMYLNDLLSTFIDIPLPNKELDLIADTKYEYSNQHILERVINSTVDSVSGEVEKKEMREMQYTDDLLTSTMNYNWDKENNDWVLVGKSKMTYNENQFPIEVDDYMLENEDFVLYRTTVATMNDSEDVVKVLVKERNEETQALENKQKAEFEYFSQHKIKSLVDYEYNENMEWEPKRKLIFEYGDIDDISNFIMHQWDNETQQWSEKLKGLLTYDEDVNIEDVIIPLDMNEIYQYVHHKITLMDIYFYMPFIEWQKMGETHFYYNMMEVDDTINDDGNDDDETTTMVMMMVMMMETTMTMMTETTMTMMTETA